MDCPKCGGIMKEVEHLGVVVDRCEGCAGIWFDEDERQRLLRELGGARVDVGTTEQGRKRNAMSDYPCPRCAGEMRAVEEGGERYELCTSCAGSFLDAGELRHLRGRPYLDTLRRRLVGIGSV